MQPDKNETLLRHYYNELCQEQMDVQAQRRVLDQREREIIEQRSVIHEEIGKFVVARTEL